MAEQLKPWTQAPFDDTHQQFFDWITSSLNSLIGQSLPPDNHGVQALASAAGLPSAPTVDPTSSTITSQGSRTSSIVTPITAIAGPSSVTFYWDGTNGSQQLVVRRDDGTKYGPSNVGSPLVVNGLSPGGPYRFYFYFDEATQLLKQVSDPVNAVGSPFTAFPAVSFDAIQQQILRGRIQAAPLFTTTGITLPGVGTTTFQSGIGGGGGGWGH